MKHEDSKFKCAFVGLVGPTNSGKSTLMNELIGKKLSIVSPKPQTTLHAIRGVQHFEDSQIIYIDTPGFQKPSGSMTSLLNRQAQRQASECDLLVWVFDASGNRMRGQFLALKKKIAQSAPQFRSLCVLNKVDKIADKKTLLPLLEELQTSGLFCELIPLSALRKNGLDILVKCLEDRLQPGSPFYPPDQVTDRSQEFQLAEAIREKIYECTAEEIPYSVWVQIEEIVWPSGDRKMPEISATIHVDCDNRKAILIGKSGQKLREIGEKARKAIEAQLKTRIVLRSFVKVHKDWKQDQRHLDQYLELK